MEFIRTYFSVKIAAIGALLRLVEDAWNERVWLAVVLLMLWTLFCTIGGILLLPIDIIVCAILWYKVEGCREVMKEGAMEMALDEE
jgi:hypothetical protein